jgi:hypothetical protein
MGGDFIKMRKRKTRRGPKKDPDTALPPLVHPTLYIKLHSFHSEDGGSKILRNIGVLSRHYTCHNPEYRNARCDTDSKWK